MVWAPTHSNPSTQGRFFCRSSLLHCLRPAKQWTAAPLRLCWLWAALVSLREECERLALLAVEATRKKSFELLHRQNDNSEVSGEGGTDCGEVEGPSDVSAPRFCTTEVGVILSPHKLYEALKDHEGCEYFQKGIAHSDGTTPDAKVFFCSTECEGRCLIERGGRFVLPLLRSSRCGGQRSTAEPMETQAAENNGKLRAPSAVTIVCQSTTLTEEVTAEAWPTKAHVLSTLNFLADTYNERLRLVLFIFSRLLADVLSAGPVEDDQKLVERFSERVRTFVQHYDEGASRGLSLEQRSFLRFSWKCVCRWLVLCFMEEGKVVGDAPDYAGRKVARPWSGGRGRCVVSEWLPLQLYLRCFWVTDANAHMYVVVSPLYRLLREGSPAAGDVCSFHEKPLSGETEKVCGDKDPNTGGAGKEGRLGGQVQLLRTLFQIADPSRAHLRGVALYDAATKINHSCLPSVRFVPSHGKVAAVVVALRDIPEGEEVRTSYIEVDKYPTKKARKEFLLSSYGFACDCPLCEGG